MKFITVCENEAYGGIQKWSIWKYAKMILWKYAKNEGY